MGIQCQFYHTGQSRLKASFSKCQPWKQEILVWLFSEEPGQNKHKCELFVNNVFWVLLLLSLLLTFYGKLNMAPEIMHPQVYLKDQLALTSYLRLVCFRSCQDSISYCCDKMSWQKLLTGERVCTSS